MELQEIYKQVRWCYDEEALDETDFSPAQGNDNGNNDCTLMNNIIKAKIADALRWICLYAPVEMLGGSDEQNNPGATDEQKQTGILVDKEETPTAITGYDGGRIQLETDFIKLARVRAAGWHRAVSVPINEYSDEYLQLYDANGATATLDRPQAAIIDKAQKVLEVWPKGSGTTEYTYVAATDEPNNFDVGSGADQKTYYPLPPRARSSFIYYIAFLVLSAYEDTRAERMLEIAKMNLGITSSK